jgi:hypothetical protein
MSDPLDRSDKLERALELAAGEARAYLAGLAGDHVQPPGSLEAVVELGGELPERGEGARAALTLARNASARRHRAAGACSGRAPSVSEDDWLALASASNAEARTSLPVTIAGRRGCCTNRGSLDFVMGR